MGGALGITNQNRQKFVIFGCFSLQNASFLGAGNGRACARCAVLGGCATPPAGISLGTAWTFRFLQKQRLPAWEGVWSRKRESNPPESAWEADAIPLGDSCKLIHEFFKFTAIANEQRVYYSRMRRRCQAQIRRKCKIFSRGSAAGLTERPARAIMVQRCRI